jgi:hypothetical protein
MHAKKIPLEIYRRMYSFGECVKYRQTISVGQVVGDCEIRTKLLSNADGLIPFVNSSLRCQMPTDTVRR